MIAVTQFTVPTEADVPKTNVTNHAFDMFRGPDLSVKIVLRVHV